MTPSRLIDCGIAMSLLVSSVVLAADDNPMLNDPWRVYVGVFDASVDSKIGFNNDDFPDLPPIDIEDILGVDDGKTVALAGVGWHFSPRHALELEYFTLNRNNLLTDTYDPPVQFDDIFIENGQISTDYDTTITRLTYGYSIIRNERSDLQLMAGIHIAKLDIAVQFSGAVCLPTTTPSVPPGCPVATSSDDTKKVSAPLPHLGIAYTYAFTPTIAMNLAAKGFAVEIDDIDGNIIEIDADVAWQPWRNVGFGVGARYFNTDVKSSGEDLNGTIEFEYFGPMIYVQATF